MYSSPTSLHKAPKIPESREQLRNMPQIQPHPDPALPLALAHPFKKHPGCSCIFSPPHATSQSGRKSPLLREEADTALKQPQTDSGLMELWAVRMVEASLSLTAVQLIRDYSPT